MHGARERKLMQRPSQLDRFEALLRGHVDELYRTALRSTGDLGLAEDLVQEASLRAYRSFLTGVEPDNFRAWMFRILTNLCIDHARLQTGTATNHLAAQEMEDVPEPANGPAQSYENARLGDDLTAAVAALPQDLQLVVQLVLVEGMSYREAAACMTCPEGTIRSRLNRARGLLRDSLSTHAPDTGDRIVPFPKRGDHGK